jgi:hypothetical protein
MGTRVPNFPFRTAGLLGKALTLLTEKPPPILTKPKPDVSPSAKAKPNYCKPNKIVIINTFCHREASNPSHDPNRRHPAAFECFRCLSVNSKTLHPATILGGKTFTPRKITMQPKRQNPQEAKPSKPPHKKPLGKWENDTRFSY